MADFFEKMKDGFNKGVATVSTGSKNMVEKTKLHSMIKNAEDEKKQLTEILGNKVYGFCMSNPEVDIPRDEVASICEEITKRNVQIEELNGKIAALDAEMNQVMGNNGINASVTCSCGYTNTPGAKFCAKCGTKLC